MKHRAGCASCFCFPYPMYIEAIVFMGTRVVAQCIITRYIVLFPNHISRMVVARASYLYYTMFSILKRFSFRYFEYLMSYIMVIILQGTLKV